MPVNELHECQQGTRHAGECDDDSEKCTNTIKCAERHNEMLAWLRSEPAMTVTVVVPSPASTSCDFERSTSIFAVGCDTSIWKGSANKQT